MVTRHVTPSGPTMRETRPNMARLMSFFNQKLPTTTFSLENSSSTMTRLGKLCFSEYNLFYVVLCVQVAHAAQTEGIVVTQFHMSGWPEHGRPASTGSVVEMLDMITKAQMSSGNRAITVLCKSVQHSLTELFSVS